MLTQEIVNFCAAECTRQMSGELSVARMVEAYEFAVDSQFVYGESLIIGHTLIRGIGMLVDERNTDYRTTPVSFANGNLGPNAQNVPRLMDQLVHFTKAMTTDEFVKEFLDIHPFVDGNGRTAAILYNVMNNTLDQPVTLPDFYKEVSR